MINEKEVNGLPGIPVLLFGLACLLACMAGFLASVNQDFIPGVLGSILAFIFICVLLGGLFMVNPNEAKVLQLFGNYTGTVKSPGLRWFNPFYSKRRISQRVRNFETGKLKVNDKAGNPIEIASVVVWRVIETAEAVFEVDDYENYVHVQSESALRNMATGYAYDSHGPGEVSLVADISLVSERLKSEIQERLAKAGVEVIEARISHLAYAPEIAAAMLQRQQASAVVAARTTIVEGAVGMVEPALDKLSSKEILELDEERKAAMVCNLLVVLCSDRHAQPVINAGSLY